MPSDTDYFYAWVVTGSNELKKSSLSKLTSNFFAFRVLTSAGCFLMPSPPKPKVAESY